MKKPLLVLAAVVAAVLVWTTRAAVRQMERDAALWEAATDRVPSRLAEDDPLSAT